MVYPLCKILWTLRFIWFSWQWKFAWHYNWFPYRISETGILHTLKERCLYLKLKRLSLQYVKKRVLHQCLVLWHKSHHNKPKVLVQERCLYVLYNRIFLYTQQPTRFLQPDYEHNWRSAAKTTHLCRIHQ